MTSSAQEWPSSHCFHLNAPLAPSWRAVCARTVSQAHSRLRMGPLPPPPVTPVPPATFRRCLEPPPALDVCLEHTKQKLGHRNASCANQGHSNRSLWARRVTCVKPGHTQKSLGPPPAWRVTLGGHNQRMDPPCVTNATQANTVAWGTAAVLHAASLWTVWKDVLRLTSFQSGLMACG